MFNTSNIKNKIDIEIETSSQEQRAWRDQELINYVDHHQRVLVWRNLSSTQKNELESYRKELLEFPNHVSFPKNDRPTRPSFNLN